MKQKWTLNALFHGVNSNEFLSFLLESKFLEKKYFLAEFDLGKKNLSINSLFQLQTFLESNPRIEELTLLFNLDIQYNDINHIENINYENYISISNNGDAKKKILIQSNVPFTNLFFKFSTIWTMVINDGFFKQLTGNQDIQSKENLSYLPSNFVKPDIEIDFNVNKKAYYEYQEKLVIHHHFVREGDEIFWLEVAPIMVVPKRIFKYIPEFLWSNLTEIDELKTLNNNALAITVFSDPTKTSLDENYNKLWSVRKQLGMDTITHEICEPVKHLNWIDPDLPVYITLKTEKGGFTRVTRYFDKNGKLCSKSQAKSLEIKEFLEDGTTCVFEETKQKGLFGWK